MASTSRAVSPANHVGVTSYLASRVVYDRSCPVAHVAHDDRRRSPWAE